MSRIYAKDEILKLAITPRESTVTLPDGRRDDLGRQHLVGSIPKCSYGIPMNQRRCANVLNTKPELLREFCCHLIAPGDETVTLYADGKAVEIPII
jgi:hypothetical protein